ncbi:hypothetical protein SEMRO_2056_G312860.1 [Seminavis robusta]|uniref:Uncharacterized protein n=1 Tax=Seminavis robusta TaxID=568900 RepID=A0A9N8EZ78_9STRA|nr:hypothetical protein SEMRO_2056_G312860.1 [Seminavis robusta]|eukprot:Sro2056_g312860.1 n/a (739) ;mRNA; r:7815-10212
MNTVEEEEIAVFGPDSAPPSSLREGPADPFRSELLLSTHTRTALTDPETIELTMMEDGNKAPANPDSDDDSSMDDPLNDPKNTYAGDMSESPSNFEFSFNSADLERDIRNSAVQTIAFEYVYGNAYDVVYSICTWPRLLLSYCLNWFRFARKKDDDSDGPVPPQEDNRVQNMSIAASQSAAIGIGAGVMAGQSAAAGAGTSTLSAAVSSLSAPTIIGLAVAAAIAVVATTTGVATGISNVSDNNATGHGGCNGNLGSRDVKQGVIQIVFSSSETNSNDNSTIGTPSTNALLLENKEELEGVFAQVYHKVTANSTNNTNSETDRCDLPYIPEDGVQMMQVEPSEVENFTNTVWFADVHCVGCSDTDPLFGTSTDPGRAVDDFVDQFTQAIKPILRTGNPEQDNLLPADQEQQDSPVDILFVALVDPITGETLPDQTHQLGPGDLILELLPNIDIFWNSNKNDREEDQLEVPQVPTASATTAAAPKATAVKVSNLTVNTQSNAPVQQDIATISPGQELVATNPAAVAPTNAKLQEPSPMPATTSAPMQQGQTSISPVLAPSAVSSPTHSTASMEQASSNDDQQQATQPTNQKNSFPPISALKNPAPSFVVPAPPSAGNPPWIVGQPMMPSGDDSMLSSSTTKSPSREDITTPPATISAVSNNPVPVPLGGSKPTFHDPVAPSSVVSTLIPNATIPPSSTLPTTIAIVPTRDMLSPESCAAQPCQAHINQQKNSPIALVLK